MSRQIDLLTTRRATPEPASGALLSPCGRYRWSLWRVWDSALPRVAWVMLNPSTADATADDPTIRRCRAFSAAWGCGSLEVVNLFAWRSTSPAALLTAADPVGPENDAHLTRAAERAGRVVVAWGAHPAASARAPSVRRLLVGVGVEVVALRLTKDGAPGHPLYVPSATVPVPYLVGGGQ